MLKNDGHNGWDRQVMEALIDSGKSIMGAKVLFLLGFNEIVHDTERYKSRRSNFTQPQLTQTHTLHKDT